MLDRLTSKHEDYLHILWQISLVLGYINAIIDWFQTVFQTARDGNALGFVVLIVLQSLWLGLNGILGAIMVFLILLLITIIPYLIIRGITK